MRERENAQDVVLARALFYTDLHQQVSAGLLSIADAERKVAEYDLPTQPHSQPILSKFREKSRGILFLRSALSTK